MIRLSVLMEGGVTVEYLERQPLTKLIRINREAHKLMRERESAIKKARAKQGRR